MNREQLEAMKVDELRKLAPTVGVKNAKQYKKQELIERIAAMMVTQQANIETAAEVVETSADADVPVINMEQKMKYIESAPVGTLVAFRLPDGKVKSAKIINRSAKSQKLKLETSYGRQFVIPYLDVIWVKSTDKWPKGVYRQLKGIVATEGSDNG